MTPLPTSDELVERLVRDLTLAQRHKLLEIGDGKPREYSLGSVGFALMRRKLIFVNELGARHLTDAGHKVRAALNKGDGVE